MVTKTLDITLVSFTENKNKLISYIQLDKSEAGEYQEGLELANQICSPWPLCPKLVVQNVSGSGFAARVLTLCRAASWVLERRERNQGTCRCCALYSTGPNHALLGLAAFGTNRLNLIFSDKVVQRYYLLHHILILILQTLLNPDLDFWALCLFSAYVVVSIRAQFLRQLELLVSKKTIIWSWRDGTVGAWVGEMAQLVLGLEMWRQTDVWCSLTSQPSLLGQL